MRRRIREWWREWRNRKYPYPPPPGFSWRKAVNDDRKVVGHYLAHETARISDSAVIASYASIGEEAHIGPHARIGYGARIDDHAELESGASVGARAEVGPRSYIGEWAIVGNDTLIGTDSHLDERVVTGAMGRNYFYAIVLGYRVQAYLLPGGTISFTFGCESHPLDKWRDKEFLRGLCEIHEPDRVELFERVITGLLDFVEKLLGEKEEETEVVA